MRFGWLMAAAMAAQAASPTAWEMNTWQDLIAGKFTNVSLTKDGVLRLAPALEPVADSGDPVVWAAARAGDGSLYLGTGHRGRLLRVDPAGRVTVVFTAPEPEIFAVTVDRAGRVYAATSPNGKVYRVENGAAREFFNPGAQYIWSLAAGADGALFVGTGTEGKVFRVTAAGQGEVYYESGQSHVTSLAVDSQGRLVAGSEPNGIVYQISAKDRAFVLYDADLGEIRSLRVARDGSIYLAALGGAAAEQASTADSKAAGAGAGAVQGPNISITVTEEAQGGIPKPTPPAAQPQQAAGQKTQAAAPVVEYAGVERSAVIRIRPDNTVDTVWTSKDETLFDVALDGDRILLATGDEGRVYSMDAGGKVTLVAQTGESEAVRLIDGERLLIATGNAGKLYRVGAGPAAEGAYEAPVHDAGTVARWGRLSWRGAACAGCAVALRTRSGNTSQPDKTWSDWSAPVSSGAQVPSPNSRYIQWKAELRGRGEAPSIDSIRLAYQAQNRAPKVTAVTVTSQNAASPSVRPVTTTAAGAGSAGAATFSVTVSDTGETTETSAGTMSQPLTRASTEQLVVTWTAEDVDADRLTYSVWFRGEDEREWKLLKGDLYEAAHIVDAEALGDGRYWFEVRVTDAMDNPAGDARTDSLASAPILVDRTPPVVTLSAPVKNSTAVVIEGRAVDGASPLRAIEYAVDAGVWRRVATADGVLDSASETFIIRLDPAPAGEHVVAVRVYDSANNAGVGRVVLR